MENSVLITGASGGLIGASYFRELVLRQKNGQNVHPYSNSHREKISTDVARCRRVAKVKPYGLDKALEVSELLPPEAAYKDLTAAHIEAYEAGLDKFMAGQWTEAIKFLHRVPPEDRVKDFLTEFIISNKRTPSPNWDGVIELQSKG